MEHDQPDIQGYWVSPRPDYGLMIFGVEHMSNYEEDNAMIRQSREAGYLFGTWYSVACDYGEMGSQHVSRCLPISKETFEIAQRVNWDHNADELQAAFIVEMAKVEQGKAGGKNA